MKQAHSFAAKGYLSLQHVGISIAVAIEPCCWKLLFYPDFCRCFNHIALFSRKIFLTLFDTSFLCLILHPSHVFVLSPLGRGMVHGQQWRKGGCLVIGWHLFCSHAPKLVGIKDAYRCPSEDAKSLCTASAGPTFGGWVGTMCWVLAVCLALPLFLFHPLDCWRACWPRKALNKVTNSMNSGGVKDQARTFLSNKLCGK